MVSAIRASGKASNMADILGADVFQGDPEAPAFCTHIAVFPLYDGALGVTVRTVWVRSGERIDAPGALGALCTENPPDTVDADPGKAKPVGFGSVYITTAVVANVFPGG